MDFMDVNYNRAQLCTIRKLDFTVGIYNNCLDKWTVIGSNLVSMNEGPIFKVPQSCKKTFKNPRFSTKRHQQSIFSSLLRSSLNRDEDHFTCLPWLLRWCRYTW